MKTITNFIRDNTPRYDEYLLRGFMNEQIAGAAEFVSTMFGEAVRLFCGVITYNGYRVFSPERRAEYELNAKDGCKVTTSDLLLVEYLFVYDDKEYSVPLYIPFLRNDVILIEDTNYVLQRSIREQAFSRNANGVTIKVIRQPIPFYYNTTYRLESVSDDWMSNEFVPTTSIHRKQRTNKRKMPNETIIHYLLCKFGLVTTLARFGLTKEDCQFVSTISNDREEYRYFSARHAKNKQTIDLFLKISKEKLAQPNISKLIASILYTVSNVAFQRHNVDALYEPSGAVFRIMLGRIIHGNGVSEIQGKKKVEAHIISVDTYLDPITKNRLSSYGIVVSDIYDLLQYVFVEIEKLSRVSHTDLYTTRIDYLEELLVDTIVRGVYLRWYDVINRLGGVAEIGSKKFNDKEIRLILKKIPDTLITRLSDSRVVQKSPPAYGDNALVGRLISKMRQSGLSASGNIINSPDHKLHTSQVVVESLNSYSKTNPGAAGSINPYLSITNNGSIKRPNYANEIDELGKYLP